MDWSRIILPQSFLFEMEVIMVTLAQLKRDANSGKRIRRAESQQTEKTIKS